MTGIIALALFIQQAAGSTLRVTVIDQTNAVVVGATVTVVGADAATKARTIEPVKTIDTGVAIVPALAPGRYIVEVEFPGFEKRVLNDVRVRPGDNRQVAMLAIQRMEASVNVEQDKQQAASDRNGPSFGTTLTRDQIDALSDDPATLQQQLQEMAGPGAVIRIDGFEGGALPAKAMIRSIRIARDQFAAEFHTAGELTVDAAGVRRQREAHEIGRRGIERHLVRQQARSRMYISLRPTGGRVLFAHVGLRIKIR